MVVACTALTFSAQATPAAELAGTAHRLPDGVTPTSYELFVEPYPERGKFSGSETIALTVTKPTNEITLNAAELKILEAQCISIAPGAVPKRAKVIYRTSAEQISLVLPRELNAGKYNLSLKFDGILNDKLRGFYRSSYTDAKGVKQWLATTQMEATDARRMFPCFDEPGFKATYTLTASIAPDCVAISNSPITQEKVDAKAHRKIVHFDTTPKMSTYLVALIVGPLKSTDEVTAQGVPVRVWSVAGKEQMGTYARDVAAKLLPFYDSYFGVDYPAKKLDLIAIPDFEAGAMENLGAITFREKLLLIDDKTASTEAKHDASSVIAHEMAHMWFGDLVTMKWWDDLWLNEAFATWMSAKAVDHLRPDWHEWDQFCIERLDSMSTDCLHSTRPIHFSVTDPNQVDQMFDEITYGKGASVLRMLERYVSEDVFRDGVQQYIKAHQYGNATTMDLWESIGHAANKDINEMMHGWVYQPGYPLVTTDTVNNRNAFLAAQERFILLKNPKQSDNNAFQTLWQIPLAFRSLAAKDENAIQRQLLTDKQTKFAQTDGPPYLINAGGDGYYRVRYTGGSLHDVSGKVPQLSVTERASLLSDQFYLALAGDIPVPDYLALTAEYKDEDDPTVTNILCDQFEKLNTLVSDTSRPAFEAFVRDRLSRAKDKLGWTVKDSDSDLTKMQRAEVLAVLGMIGQDKSTIKEARDLFAGYLKDKDSLNPDLVNTVVRIVAYNGSDSDYDKIEDLWHTAKTPELELRFLYALADFRDPALIQSTLAMAITDDVRNQDAPGVVAHVVSTVAGRRLGWDFVTSHWKTLNERYPQHMIPRIIHSADSLVTMKDHDQIETFFHNNACPFGTRTIAKALEQVEVNAHFRSESGAALSSWLSSNIENHNEKLQSSMR
jgi:puromycin-sensitive aminopeptidase